MIRLSFLMPLMVMRHFRLSVLHLYLWDTFKYVCAYVFLAAQDIGDKICWKLDSQRGASQLQNVCVEANCLSFTEKCTLGIALFCIFFLLILMHSWCSVSEYWDLQLSFPRFHAIKIYRNKEGKIGRSKSFLFVQMSND